MRKEKQDSCKGARSYGPINPIISGKEQVIQMTKKSFESAAADIDRIFYTASPFARSSLLYVQEIGGR